jgi:hypothetical protein
MTGDPSECADEWFRDAELLDFSSVPLKDLLSLDRGALDIAIRQVLDDIDNATEAISSWSSFVDR